MGFFRNITEGDKWNAWLGLVPKRMVFMAPPKGPDTPKPAELKAEDLHKEKNEKLKSAYSEVQSLLLNGETPAKNLEGKISKSQTKLISHVNKQFLTLTERAKGIKNHAKKADFLKNLKLWQEKKIQDISNAFKQFNKDSKEIFLGTKDMTKLAFKISIALNQLRENVLSREEPKKNPEKPKKKEKKESTEKTSGEKPVEVIENDDGSKTYKLSKNPSEKALSKLFGAGFGKMIAKIMKSLGVFFSVFKDKNGVISGFATAETKEMQQKQVQENDERNRMRGQLDNAKETMSEGMSKGLQTELFSAYTGQDTQFQDLSAELARKENNLNPKDNLESDILDRSKTKAKLQFLTNMNDLRKNMLDYKGENNTQDRATPAQVDLTLSAYLEHFRVDQKGKFVLENNDSYNGNQTETTIDAFSQGLLEMWKKEGFEKAKLVKPDIEKTPKAIRESIRYVSPRLETGLEQQVRNNFVNKLIQLGFNGSEDPEFALHVYREMQHDMGSAFMTALDKNWDKKSNDTTPLFKDFLKDYKGYLKNYGDVQRAKNPQALRIVSPSARTFFEEKSGEYDNFKSKMSVHIEDTEIKAVLNENANNRRELGYKKVAEETFKKLKIKPAVALSNALYLKLNSPANQSALSQQLDKSPDAFAKNLQEIGVQFAKLYPKFIGKKYEMGEANRAIEAFVKNTEVSEKDNSLVLTVDQVALDKAMGVQKKVEEKKGKEVKELSEFEKELEKIDVPGSKEMQLLLQDLDVQLVKGGLPSREQALKVQKLIDYAELNFFGNKQLKWEDFKEAEVNAGSESMWNLKSKKASVEMAGRKLTVRRIFNLNGSDEYLSRGVVMMGGQEKPFDLAQFALVMQKFQKKYGPYIKENSPADMGSFMEQVNEKGELMKKFLNQKRYIGLLESMGVESISRFNDFEQSLSSMLDVKNPQEKKKASEWYQLIDDFQADVEWHDSDEGQDLYKFLWTARVMNRLKVNVDPKKEMTLKEYADHLVSSEKYISVLNTPQKSQVDWVSNSPGPQEDAKMLAEYKHYRDDVPQIEELFDFLDGDTVYFDKSKTNKSGRPLFDIKTLEWSRVVKHFEEAEKSYVASVDGKMEGGQPRGKIKHIDVGEDFIEKYIELKKNNPLFRSLVALGIEGKDENINSIHPANLTYQELIHSVLTPRRTSD